MYSSRYDRGEPVVPHPSATASNLERRRSSSVFLTSLLRNASRKSQFEAMLRARTTVEDSVLIQSAQDEKLMRTNPSEVMSAKTDAHSEVIRHSAKDDESKRSGRKGRNPQLLQPFNDISTSERSSSPLSNVHRGLGCRNSITTNNSTASYCSGKKGERGVSSKGRPSSASTTNAPSCSSQSTTRYSDRRLRPLVSTEERRRARKLGRSRQKYLRPETPAFKPSADEDAKPEGEAEGRKNTK